ncbi:enoyl-CoA hydratase/isomerase family protein [Novosphingobium sp. G106]|uniref:enoyl-CoA hydratase/isomerase family protein n=1 Tax=Novosphingobium sp. G106 TaxID=2849500 RepID=UPI001C2D04C3|nr:enoyl-CoA hydratase/isomerase family protein [Novosphingobium sp. G106]MBV1690057.1 enoyl-CoA hydratase/isomerase family protein [Novosphingobium sp. G106]
MAEVELTKEGPVALITLNRGAKRNAISIAMQRELVAALEAVAGDADVRALILTGAGSDFCVGGDRAVVEQIAADAGFEAMAAAQHRRTAAVLFGLEVPVIAAIEGAAFGFGAELAAGSDIVVMGDAARLADPHVRFGLPPAPIVALAWPLMSSRLVAAELVLTGREVPANEALALGLASRVVPAGTALAVARTLAETIATLPVEGVALAKRAIRLDVADLDRFYPQPR